MAFLWGSTALNVIRDTYNPPVAETVITEVALLPDPADLSAICTVLQQGGRQREKVSLNVFSYTYAEYQALKADYYAGIQRTFTGADSYNATMMIMSLSAASRKLFPTRFEYSMTLVEV